MGKDDTWTISSGNVYCYLLVGTEKALLIDTCYGEGDLRRFVEEITDKPVIVANTHGHFDHTGGNPWWKEAYMSAESAKGAKKAFNEEMQKRLESMPYPDYKINIIDENTVFDLGGRTVKVVPIPAHHLGSLAFIDSASRYLFTGDELEAGQVLMFLTEKGQMEQIEAHKANMEKLLSLADHYDAVCPAHNGTPINKKYISDYLELDKQILAGTQIEMPNTAGFGFPPKVGDTGPFSGDIRRAQYGGASVCYKK
jgi:glyoxylase-like metal-dependent hydrolase (beta-lactamase superfamily II)